MAALSRPLDKAYIIYFSMMFMFGTCIDLQDFWPQALLPQFLKNIRALYFSLSNDPLGQNLLGSNVQLAWFHSFVYLQIFFQLPACIFSIRGLLKGTRATYLLLIAYGVSTATTVLPCLATFLVIPSHGTATSASLATLTNSERLFLLGNYIPFFLFPLIMAVDCSMELIRDIEIATRATRTAKGK